ncbi:hypothetical protein [Biostraticola tofi]|uniref:Uncharacterized protein n=1 Tax=Biostraticola tofi TaxID=466109 RepID=A0A4R3YIG4_9GAMM|nr:hypothetical protein [Biostraticola tofi]TCV91098.1 hypothetical protein EDC52_1228 [Biostraticola tofi]
MEIKDKLSVWVLFLSIIYMIFCSFIFFSISLVIITLLFSNEFDINDKDIIHVAITSLITGITTGLGSWIFAKLDEREARKSLPADPK